MECGDCESYSSHAEAVVAQANSSSLDFARSFKKRSDLAALEMTGLWQSCEPFLFRAILVVGKRVDGAAVGDGLGVADFLNRRSDDGGVVFGVAKFEVHAAAYVLELEHGTSPGGASNSDLNRVGTEFGMAGDESVAAPEQDGGVAVVHGLNVENGGRRKIVEENSAFDLRLDDGVVDVIRQVGVRVEHYRCQT
jgi:hypothetical protein